MAILPAPLKVTKEEYYDHIKTVWELHGHSGGGKKKKKGKKGGGKKKKWSIALGKHLSYFNDNNITFLKFSFICNQFRSFNQFN